MGTNYPVLSDYLLKHTYNYMENHAKDLKMGSNILDPEEIVNRIMGDNVDNFLKKYYH